MIFNLYASMYYLYRTALFRAQRLFVGFFLLTWVFSEIPNSETIKIPLLLFYLFILIEAYFHFRIARYRPTVTLDKNDKTNLYSSCTMQLLYPLLTQHETSEIFKKILAQESSRMMLQKCTIEQHELQTLPVPVDSLISYASELAISVHGNFITTMDVLAAYLLMTEDKTKLLFSKKMKPEELVHVLQWARLDFPYEEHPKSPQVTFSGGGIGDALVTGWTLETKKYTIDFTYTALQKKPLLMGRAGEYHEVVEGISKAEHNNVLLVGDVGSGRENLVRALAYHSFSGTLGGSLNNKHFFELMLGQLIAGATDRSNLEERLQAIINEVSHARNVILYIPEFQNILGTGSYNVNLSGALLPYLKNGSIPVVATITQGNYKSYLESNPLRQVFEVVILHEPTKDIAFQMLFDKSLEIEKNNHVILSYKAIAASVVYADRYLQDNVLPGSAVELLQDAAHEVAISSRKAFENTGKKIVLEEDVIAKLEEKTHIAVSEPKQEEKELLLHLEDKLHERIVDQVEAISAISEAMRRLRSGFAQNNKPVSFLFLGPAGVGKTETAKALAALYFGGEKNMIRLDMSEYADTDGVKRLLGASPGQGDERGELTDKVHDKPFSLILLDEFEKANPKILDLFLQVLEDGRLTDNKGKTVSFVNSIIIATSNAASEFIREEIGSGVVVDKSFQQKLLEHLQSKGLFKPELLNRFDDIVTFKPLSQQDIQQITLMLLKNVSEKLKEQDIRLVFDQAIIQKIAKEGFDQQFGARPIRRYIQANIEDLLASKKLQNQIPRGSVITVLTDQDGVIVAKTS